jgi:Rhamnogalacturonan I lyases beta-sheet domain/Bacterial Ig-like domain
VLAVRRVLKPYQYSTYTTGARRALLESLESRQLLSGSGPSGSGFGPEGTLPARQVEALDRGVVAIRQSSTAVYVGFRMLGTDPANITFNLYCSIGGAPATLVASLPTSTNFVHTNQTLTQSRAYFVRPVIGGVEQAPSESFTLPANAPVRQFLNVPLQIPPGGHLPATPNTLEHDYTYNANDASVGDLDGDGDYEIVLKWDPSDSKDNSQEGYTGNVFLDAYDFDGQGGSTLLWRIDLGRNVRAGAHYSPFLVYDFDGDGRAEVVTRTAEATIDGVGTVIGNASADYRNSSGYILSGPEYLTAFNGETGAIIDSIPFEPARGSVSSWGDSYGNRVDRFQAAPAYLDGERPSMVWARGYAGPQSGFSARNEVAAFDYRDGELTRRWLFVAATNGANPGYVGQTAHSITVADVDGDGKDEVTTGGAALDDDGTLLYNSGRGHGDALHLSDMDPSRPGLEVFMPHESPGSYGNAGGEFRDARTGELIFGIPANNDVGRGVAADIDPNSPGYEMWATTTDPNGGVRQVYSAAGLPLYNTPSNMFYNFLVWWDADPMRELMDGTTISNWNNPGRVNMDLDPATSGTQSAPNGASNNGSKSTPALVGDVFGDWREEAIWRRSDNTALMIFTTTIPSTFRTYTLMHETQYRAAIAWQNSGYNQPPHPGFFFGAVSAAGAFPTIPAANVFVAGVDVIAPQVSSAAFLFETSHAVQIEFDEEIDPATLSVTDLVLDPVAAGANLTPDIVTYDAPTRTATFTFNSLIPDGNYDARLLAMSVEDLAGNPLASEYSFSLFVLAGDANRDRTVDVADLGILASNWQQSPRTFSQGNFDYSANGLVDVNDLGILASQWQQTLGNAAVPSPSTRLPSRRPVRQIDLVFASQPV